MNQTQIKETHEEAKITTNKEKLKKSVTIDNTSYTVKIANDTITATEYTHTLPGYGNGFGTEYIIDLCGKGKYARTTVYCYNCTWACRGHGVSDAWIETSGFLAKKDAEQLLQKVKNDLLNAEDDTPDVLSVFCECVDKVNPD
jgi:hypothetical protein